MLNNFILTQNVLREQYKARCIMCCKYQDIGTVKVVEELVTQKENEQSGIALLLRHIQEMSTDTVELYKNPVQTLVIVDDSSNYHV